MARAKKKDESTELGFEAALEKLESIVKQLEKGELTLDESLDNFAEGMNLSKLCLNKINYAQQQIDKILVEDQGKLVESPLKLQGDEPC